MASPLDIIKKEPSLYLPKKIDLAINLIQAFITNNNPLGLKIAIILSGAKDFITYDDNNGVVFNIDELCSLCRIDRRYLSSNIKRTTQTFYTYVNDSGGTGGTHPIHSYEYLNANKEIRIEISSKAKTLFTELRKKDSEGGYQYTKAISRNLMIYDLKDVTKHTLKMQLLLEMINNFSHSKRKNFSLEELNGYFGTNYIRYGELERKILKPVRNDTLKYSSISFEYQPTKDISGSNKITSVTIDITDNINLLTL